MIQRIDVCNGDADGLCAADRYLGGAFRAWALVGAYGDLGAVADRLALESNVDKRECAFCGGSARRSTTTPTATRRATCASRRAGCMPSWRATPIRVMLAHEAIVDEIDALRRADLRQASAVAPVRQDLRGSVLVLPDAPWSRRVLGCVANALATAEPRRAHEVLKTTQGGDYAVSVRAPLEHPAGAHELCGLFGGGGRARAAGIDGLPADALERFVRAFASARWGDAAKGAYAARSGAN